MFKLLARFFNSNPFDMGALKKGKKLNRKEYEELLYNLRKLTPHIRDQVAPLVHHTDFCHQKLIELEDELRTLKQKHFFEAPKVAVVANEWKKEPKTFSPLNERLKAMLDNGQYGSDDWKRTLKWNKISDQWALKIARGELNDSSEENKSCGSLLHGGIPVTG